MERLAQVEQRGDRGRITLTRSLDIDPEALWSLVATAPGLSRWMAPTTMDARRGGEVHIAFEGGDPVNGQIQSIDPERVLAFSWTFPGESASLLRFELDGAEGLVPTRLRIDHEIGWAHAPGYGAGWQAYTDRLDDVIHGRSPRDFMSRVMELMPLYRRG